MWQFENLKIGRVKVYVDFQFKWLELGVNIHS